MLPSDRCDTSQFLCRQNCFKMGCISNQFLLVPYVKQIATPCLLICFVKSRLFITARRILPTGHTCLLILPQPQPLSAPLRSPPICATQENQLILPPRGSGLQENPSLSLEIKKLHPPAGAMGEHWWEFKPSWYIATLLGSNPESDSLWDGGKAGWELERGRGRSSKT